MKTALLLSLLLLFCGVFTPQKSFSSNRPRIREIAILIGYVDDHDLRSIQNIFYHKYGFNRSVVAEQQIQEWLALKDFAQENEKNIFKNEKTGVRVTILNPNVLCPGENPLASIRHMPCKEQMIRSRRMMLYLEQNLNKFDELIYLGHSRKGLGLGVGPFADETTFDLRFYNDVEAGNLKRVVMASCDSNTYYRDRVSLKTGIQFVGSDGDKDLVGELLPVVLNEILSF